MPRLLALSSDLTLVQSVEYLFLNQRVQESSLAVVIPPILSHCVQMLIDSQSCVDFDDDVVEGVHLLKADKVPLILSC